MSNERMTFPASDRCWNEECDSACRAPVVGNDVVERLEPTDGIVVRNR